MNRRRYTIAVASGSLAGRHVRVEWSGAGATVNDLQSTLGTQVGGVNVRSCELPPGEELALAGFFRLRLDGARQGPYR